jgi:hypothetical protein
MAEETARSMLSPHRRAGGVRVLVPRILRFSGPAVFGLAVTFSLVVSCGVVQAAPGPAGMARSTAAVDAAAGNGPCSTPTVSANLSGLLAVDGGPLDPSAVGGVLIGYSFYDLAEVHDVPNGTLASENCTLEHGASTTNATGGFTGDLVTPTNSCGSGPSGEQCTSYSGPYGPVTVRTSEIPPGYGLSSSGAGSPFVLSWVADLARISLAPANPIATLASGGSQAFVASPEMANGSASPVVSNVSWGLSGAGYRFAVPPDSASATVAAGPGWSNGTLSVGASVTIGPSTFTTPVVTVDLATVPTVLAQAALNRTTVDAGNRLALEVNATAAIGYSYTISVGSSLAVETFDPECASSVLSPESVAVSCSAEVAFPTPGDGVLSAAVSNGPSESVWTSPNVTVAPPPTLSVTPSSPVGYAGSALPVEMTAASGAGPYVSACFDPGFGTASCRSGPGPTWEFTPTYPTAGNFSASVWLLDATGANHSRSVRVQVVDPLSLGPLSTGGSGLSAGVPTLLLAALAGGVLPATAWWNVTGQSTPIATTAVPSDGPVSVDFRPSATGSARLLLTVRDGLGTVVETTLAVRIGPGPVAALTPGEGNASTVVGEPLGVVWHAVDALGDPVPTFQAAVDLLVRAATGTAALSWVNLSGLGALSASPEGSFAIPASAWTNGTLPLTVTPAEAGSLALVLEGGGLPAGTPPVTLSARPDVQELRLFDPVVATPGADTNHTFWRVSDRFGDPVPGAFLVLQYRTAGAESDAVLPIGWTGPGATGVWVNYTVPAGDAGSVRILDAAGDILYGPVALPAPRPTAGPSGALAGLSVAFALGVGIAGGSVSYARRRRADLEPPRTEEEELRRLAEGRAEVVEIVRSFGHADSSSIGAAWSAEPPTATELEEWLASLVADGTLRAAAGPTGRSEYALAPPRGSDPRIFVDAEALERAVALREAAVREDDPPASP